MAYINQEQKAVLAPEIKKVLKKYGMQGTISIRHHMTLVVTIKKGKLDFTDSSVNTYHIQKTYAGKEQSFLLELLGAMRGKLWYDRSDVQSDYFDTAYYTDINIGTYESPYEKIL